MSPILETCSADYTMLVHHARRSDGQWFVRYQQRGPWGYAWTAWRPSVEPDMSRARQTGRRARLPKVAA